MRATTLGAIACAIALVVSVVPAVLSTRATDEELAKLQRTMYRAAQRDNVSADDVPFSKEPTQRYQRRIVTWSVVAASFALAAFVLGIGARGRRVMLIVAASLAFAAALVGVIRIATIPGVDHPLPMLDQRLVLALLAATLVATALYVVALVRARPRSAA